MKPRSILRPVPLAVAAAAALVSTACVDRLPSGVTPAVPNAPHATLIPTTPYTAIDGGQTHACGIASGGQIYCWGRNASGQLGDSTAANSSVPVTVYQAGVTFASFSSGAIHNCALTSAGQAYCWGYNGDGRLGDTTFVQPLRPVPVVTNVTFASVSAGNNHTCGLDASGNSYCWGNNAWSQVGDSTTSYAVVPVATHMPAGVTFTQIAAGTNFTCALDGTGQAWCWGYNGYGAVGNNSVLTRRVPGAVIQPAGVTFASVYAEYDYACALDGGGQAYCWGRNDFYQLGDSTTTNR
jgi:alpha-tubulin suppressor-like RCC1 family protein